MKAQSARKSQTARQASLFSCSGPACKHLFTAFYFIIALSPEIDRGVSKLVLEMLRARGSLRVRAVALGLFSAVFPLLCVAASGANQLPPNGQKQEVS